MARRMIRQIESSSSNAFWVSFFFRSGVTLTVIDSVRLGFVERLMVEKKNT